MAFFSMYRNDPQYSLLPAFTLKMNFKSVDHPSQHKCINKLLFLVRFESNSVIRPEFPDTFYCTNNKIIDIEPRIAFKRLKDGR